MVEASGVGWCSDGVERHRKLSIHATPWPAEVGKNLTTNEHESTRIRNRNSINEIDVFAGYRFDLQESNSIANLKELKGRKSGPIIVSFEFFEVKPLLHSFEQSMSLESYALHRTASIINPIRVHSCTFVVQAIGPSDG